MDKQRFYGLYRGSVVDNRDPQKNGRLKVIIPQILGTVPTEWAWAVDTASLKSMVPAVGQGVWVMFEGGDPLYPIWVGVFGTNADTGKYPLAKPLAASTSLQSSIVTTTVQGSVQVDILATLVSLANKVHTLETQVAALQAYNTAHP
jgi:hypothetical protein